MAAEQRLLDAARAAVARGEPEAGLGPLKQHAARFPNGILTEEREALAVRILAAIGRSRDALARAEDFQRRFPNSLFAPTVEAARAMISGQNSATESKP